VTLRATRRVTPLCPRCNEPERTIQYRVPSGFLGTRYVYFCGACTKVLGISQRKGFWIGYRVEVELDLIPLLAIQRELYDMPRGARRFQAYLRTLVDEDTGDLALPLVTMNPMGKDHVPALLDTLRQFGAEDVARNVIKAAMPAVENVNGRFTVGLVVADDAHGGWTDRYCSEFSHRFEGRALAKRGWIVA
jgi:hypothetical protein